MPLIDSMVEKVGRTGSPQRKKFVSKNALKTGFGGVAEGSQMKKSNSKMGLNPILRSQQTGVEVANFLLMGYFALSMIDSIIGFGHLSIFCGHILVVMKRGTLGNRKFFC